MSELNLNDEINGYQIQKPLGEGTFGRTYKVTKDGKAYALKEIYINQLGSLERNKRRIQLECKALELLGEHPRIPKFYEHFKISHFEYIVQEFIDGESLKEQLESSNLFSQDELVDFLFSLLTTLKYVHNYKFPQIEAGEAYADPYKLIHRDIKPNNIIKQNEDYYLIDFGLLK